MVYVAYDDFILAIYKLYYGSGYLTADVQSAFYKGTHNYSNNRSLDKHDESKKHQHYMEGFSRYLPYSATELNKPVQNCLLHC